MTGDDTVTQRCNIYVEQIKELKKLNDARKHLLEQKKQMEALLLRDLDEGEVILTGQGWHVRKALSNKKEGLKKEVLQMKITGYYNEADNPDLDSTLRAEETVNYIANALEKIKEPYIKTNRPRKKKKKNSGGGK